MKFFFDVMVINLYLVLFKAYLSLVFMNHKVSYLLKFTTLN